MSDKSPESGVQHSLLPEIPVVTDSLIAEMQQLPHIGIGRQVVLSAAQLSQEMVSHDEEPMARSERLHGIFTSGARQRLANLSPEQQEHFMTMLQSEPASPWLSGQLEAAQHMTYGTNHDGSATQFIGTLVAKKSKDRYVVPGRLFVNFLEWHNAALVERQQALDQEAPGLKRQYKAAIREAVENGWMPEAAEQRLALIDTTRLVADDGGWTGMQGRHGYHQDAPRPTEELAGYAVLDSTITDPELRYHVIVHELTHALLKGISIRLFGTGLGGKAVLEALVEYTAEGLLNGKPELRIPPNSQTFYRLDRLMFQRLNGTDPDILNPGFFLQAALEDNPARKHTAEQTLHERLRQVHPEEDVATALRTIVDPRRLHSLRNRLAQRHLLKTLSQIR